MRHQIISMVHLINIYKKLVMRPRKAPFVRLKRRAKLASDALMMTALTIKRKQIIIGESLTTFHMKMKTALWRTRHETLPTTTLASWICRSSTAKIIWQWSRCSWSLSLCKARASTLRFTLRIGRMTRATRISTTVIKRLMMRRS